MQPSFDKNKARFSLLPLLTFVAIFLGSGLYLQSQGVDYAFYQLPAPVAILPAIVLAFILNKTSINQRNDVRLLTNNGFNIAVIRLKRNTNTEFIGSKASRRHRQ